MFVCFSAALSTLSLVPMYRYLIILFCYPSQILQPVSHSQQLQK